jgi:hypothetical protein
VTMNAMPPSEVTATSSKYEVTRFNALQHGILSRHAVLPWEDRSEYQALLDALVVEHAPQGPTEGHLVEELACIIWRKRRLQLAEAAIYREKLRKDTTSTFDPDQIAAAALLPVAGSVKVEADIPRALIAIDAETASHLRDLKRDRAMTNRAFGILTAGAPDAYSRALAALQDDTRSYWLECLGESPRDGLTYKPTAEALEGWIRRHWFECYEGPISGLDHRDAIKEQAFGSAYATKRLEVTARYEVHLDRKLERTLSMLIRLREFRATAAPT